MYPAYLFSRFSPKTSRKYCVDCRTFQILMLSTKRMDGCVPGKDVGPEAFDFRVHAVAPCLLSAARSRFWRSVSRAVSFS